MNIQEQWSVGTAENCDVQVTDEYASAHHCDVGKSLLGHFYVRDAGSMNGTYIKSGDQSRRVYYIWQPIFPGEVLVVGRSEIPWARS